MFAQAEPGAQGHTSFEEPVGSTAYVQRPELGPLRRQAGLVLGRTESPPAAADQAAAVKRRSEVPVLVQRLRTSHCREQFSRRSSTSRGGKVFPMFNFMGFMFVLFFLKRNKHLPLPPQDSTLLTNLAAKRPCSRGAGPRQSFAALSEQQRGFSPSVWRG